MIINTGEQAQGQFLKKGEDISDSDIITFKDAGIEVEGKFGMQAIFKVACKGKDGNIAVNKMSQRACAMAMGQDTTAWIGKDVTAKLVNQNVSGKFLDVLYLIPAGYELGEYGITLAQGVQPAPKVKVSDGKSEKELLGDMGVDTDEVQF